MMVEVGVVVVEVVVWVLHRHQLTYQAMDMVAKPCVRFALGYIAYNTDSWIGSWTVPWVYRAMGLMMMMWEAEVVAAVVEEAVLLLLMCSSWYVVHSSQCPKVIVVWLVVLVALLLFRLPWAVQLILAHFSILSIYLAVVLDQVPVLRQVQP
jgi:hypothetical protein